MNLILTPVYKNYDVTARMCEAIDQHTVNSYLHILIDDNGDKTMRATPYRRFLHVDSDVEGTPHVNQLGQMVQLGYDYARQPYWNGNQQITDYDHVFLIESDVIVEPEWDKKMIDLVCFLPFDWGTLDCMSVDEFGKMTYPDIASPLLGTDDRINCFIREYPQFQCTLFNPHALKVARFDEFPSHFDIMFGRKVTQETGRRHFEAKDIQVLHVNGGGNSRGLL